MTQVSTEEKVPENQLSDKILNTTNIALFLGKCYEILSQEDVILTAR
jgi:hypothetical protein